MSRFVFAAALLAAGFVAVADAAPQNTATPNQPAAASHATPNHSPVKPGDRNCIRDTGSLIPPKKGECLPINGRSYSQQDIQSTGERTLGPALQKLDPSVTVHGNGY